MTSLHQTPLWRPTHAAFARAHTHASLQCGPPAAVSDARDSEGQPIGLPRTLRSDNLARWKSIPALPAAFLSQDAALSLPRRAPAPAFPLILETSLHHFLAGNGRKGC